MIKPHLTYYMAAIPMKLTESARIDKAHRRQLRILMGHHYSTSSPMVSVKAIYEQTNAVPLSISIAKMRWTLLGHMLRQSADTPHFKAMKIYFKKTFNGVKRRQYSGARNTSTMTMIDKEFRMAEGAMKAEVNIDKIQCRDELDRLKDFAADRRMWRRLVDNIRSRMLMKWNAKESKRKNEPLPWAETPTVGSSRNLTAEQRAITPRFLLF